MPGGSALGPSCRANCLTGLDRVEAGPSHPAGRGSGHRQADKGWGSLGCPWR